jgi:hypothetical protein
MRDVAPSMIKSRASSENDGSSAPPMRSQPTTMTSLRNAAHRAFMV